MNEQRLGRHVKDFSEVERAEHLRIDQIRTNRQKLHGPLPLHRGHTGLALSGGGIRSAAFGLGVLHSLQNRGILRRIDYLSTVSGGGYIGATLTYLEALRSNPAAGDQARMTADWQHTEPDRPSATPHAASRVPPALDLGSRFVGAKTTQKSANAFLDHIRGHGNYLSQGRRLGIGAALAVVLRSVLVGVVIWLPLAAVALTLLALSLGSIGNLANPPLVPLWPMANPPLVPLWPMEGVGHQLSLLLWPMVWFLLLMPIYAIACSVIAKLRGCADGYAQRTFQQWVLAWLLKLAIGCAVLASLPYAAAAIKLLDMGVLKSSGLVSIAGGLLASLLRPNDGKTRAGWLSGIAADVGAALMLYGALLVAMDLGGQLLEKVDHGGRELVAMDLGDESFGSLFPASATLGGLTLWQCLALALAAVVPVAIAWFVDLNVIGLHRLYRDRLMETFMPNRGSVGEWAKATDAEKIWLADVCNKQSIGPYHLLNTNIILTRSKNTSRAGRGGDSFVLSPLFCGSDATGWRTTREWVRFPGGLNSQDDHLSLATAMAISGAAVNPDAGKGPTRHRLVALAMRLLNLRLACWLPNPLAGLTTTTEKEVTHVRSAMPSWFWLGWQMLRMNYQPEKSPLVELSDGGHFENLGIYELVRRRARIIIAVDAGCDPGFQFADLGYAMERCRVDFGVDIRFADPKLDLRHLLPVPTGESPFRRLFPMAERGVAIARIRYPACQGRDASDVGYLIYVKTTLVEGLPADIYAYKQGDPSFPDQSTADQWFDEAQFEAYRELGYALFERFLDRFATAGPARATIHTAAEATALDVTAYGELIDWLHGRERAMVA